MRQQEEHGEDRQQDAEPLEPMDAVASLGEGVGAQQRDLPVHVGRDRVRDAPKAALLEALLDLVHDGAQVEVDGVPLQPQAL